MTAVLALLIAVLSLSAPTLARRGHFRFGPPPTIAELTDVGGTLFFVRDDFDGSGGLWKSDGTASGTVLVKPFTDFAFATELTDVSGTLYFILVGERVELWKSDGTTSGTTAINQLDFGRAPGSFQDEFLDDPPLLKGVGSTLFFTGSDPERGAELWKSDGTAAGTVPVKDIFPGPEGSFPSGLTTLGDTLYFSAKDGVNGIELWSSDGTESGTRLVRNIRSLSASAFPQELTPLGDRLYFFAIDTEHGFGLWRTDGSNQGTTLVKAIPGEVELDTELVATGTTLYFETVSFDAFDFFGRPALWRSDGTDAGTLPLKSFGGGGGFSLPFELEAAGSNVFLLGDESQTGSELWKSDGTSAGTALVRDVRRGPKSSNPQFLHAHGDLVFFAANDGRHGVEPWVADGSSGGARLLTDIARLGKSSFPEGFASAGDVVFFATRTRTGGELWVTDGSRTGTRRLG